jgi:uncharacterized protein YjiS (DUF1127 family)
MAATPNWTSGRSARFDDIAEIFRTALANLGAWRGRRAVYNRTVAELDALTDRDLADLGIPRTDIRRIARDAAFAGADE